MRTSVTSSPVGGGAAGDGVTGRAPPENARASHTKAPAARTRAKTAPAPARRPSRNRSSIVMAQVPVQSGQSLRRLALHGSDGAAEHRGHVALGEVLVVAKDDAGALS